MVGVGFGEVFYSKVVNTQGKGGLACLVYQQACDVWYRFLAVGSYSFNKFIEIKDTSFF